MQFQGFFVGQDKKMQLKNKKKTKVRDGCLEVFTNSFHLQAVTIISCDTAQNAQFLDSGTPRC